MSDDQPPLSVPQHVKGISISVAGPDSLEQASSKPDESEPTGHHPRQSVMSSFSDYAPSEVETNRGSVLSVGGKIGSQNDIAQNADEEWYDFSNNVEFVKTLDSDVQEAEAFQLLLECKISQPQFYGEFTDAEIKRLANYFSVLEFGQEEQIIQKGENATFMGIILSGQYEVPVTEDLTVLLEKGSLVGEMNYFDAGQRVASVKANTDGVIAVITYMDIDQMRSVDPVLGSKITHMIAKATIKALKYSASVEKKSKENAASGVRVKKVVRDTRLVDNPDVVHTETETTETKESTSKNKAEPENARQRMSMVEDANVNEVYKAEMLFRSRLQKQEKESHQQMQKELERRRKAEKVATDRQYKIDTRNRRIKQMQDEITAKDEELRKLSLLQDEHVKSIEGLEHRVETLTGRKDDLEKRLQAEKEQVVSLQKKVQDMEEQAKHSEEDRVTQLRESLKDVTRQLEAAQAELRTRSEQHEEKAQHLSAQLEHEKARRQSVNVKVTSYKKTLIELQELSDENEQKLRKSSADDSGVLDPLQLELHTQFMRQKVEERVADPELRDHAMIVIEYRDQLHRTEAQMGQKMLELSDTRRALERTQGELSAMTGHFQQTKETLERQTATDAASRLLMRTRIHGLQVLLQHQVLFSYVNTFRLRNMLRNTHQSLLDLGVEVLHSIDREKAQRFALSHYSGELQKQLSDSRLEERMRTIPGLAMRKSLYKQVHHTSGAMVEVVQQLHECFGELRRQKVYWKTSANQLLARNNELKEHIKQNDNHIHSLKKTVAAQERELEGVMTLHHGRATPSAILPGIGHPQDERSSNARHDALPESDEPEISASRRGSVVPPVVKARKRQAQELEMLRRRVIELEALASHIAATPAEMVNTSFPPRYIHSARRARPAATSRSQNMSRSNAANSPKRRAATARAGDFTVAPKLQNSTRPRTAAEQARMVPAPPKAQGSITQVDDEDFFAEVFK